jgi:hypothetical protein
VAIPRHGVAINLSTAEGEEEMKTLYYVAIAAVILVVMALEAKGQDAAQSLPRVVRPEEVTCTKHQHVLHHPAYCHGNPNCSIDTGISNTCTAITICEAAKPDTCEEDTRIVTEREWQDLLQRVEKIEATGQFHLDVVQAKLNPNAKPCGPDNHDGACVDVTLRHIVNHLYIHKENCERYEGVACTRDQELWAPLGKPVFEDKTP